MADAFTAEDFARALEVERERTNEQLIADFLEIGRYDWYVSSSYRKLHFATLSEVQQAHIPECWSIPGPVRLSCGRLASWLHIPGIFTRMGAMRCKGCCRALDYPPGKGSPKNDDECRKLLGLPPSGPGATETESREIAP